LLFLLFDDDFFLVFDVAGVELSEVLCAKLWVTGKAKDTHSNGASHARLKEENDKKRIPVALENIKLCKLYT